MGAGHDHGVGRNANSRRLAITLGLVTLYMVAEVVGGLLTNSLALLADAGHMLSDAGALALSLFAIWLAARPARSSYTYGYYRTEILAALVNGATLVAISIFIFLEAFKRIGEPPEVQGALMMGIATGGLVVNLVGLWILNAGRNESLNVRGAWLHVMTDALGSIGGDCCRCRDLAVRLALGRSGRFHRDRAARRIQLVESAQGDCRRADGECAGGNRRGRGTRFASRRGRRRGGA